MRKAIVTTAVISVLLAGGMGGCQGGLTVQNAEDSADGILRDLRTQASEELKKAFSDEVAEFFKSDDLSKTLGIDSEGQLKLEESIKAYINNYSADEEKLSEAKESLDTLLENAEGLSAEEIQEKISGIFSNADSSNY